MGRLARNLCVSFLTRSSNLLYLFCSVLSNKDVKLWLRSEMAQFRNVIMKKLEVSNDRSDCRMNKIAHFVGSKNSNLREKAV